MVEENTASGKTHAVFVQVKNSTLCHYDSIALQDWTKEKKSFFAMAVGLSKGVSCKAKTRKTEKELLSCSNGFLNAVIADQL